MRIANLSTIKLGDMRVRKNCQPFGVYVQERVAGGWEYTQLHNDQTLTSVVAELKRRNYKFVGRDENYYVYSDTPTIPADVIDKDGVWSRPYYDTTAGAWRDPIAGLFNDNGPIA